MFNYYSIILRYLSYSVGYNRQNQIKIVGYNRQFYNISVGYNRQFTIFAV
jgi:hypothetical protein